MNIFMIIDIIGTIFFINNSYNFYKNTKNIIDKYNLPLRFAYSYAKRKYYRY